MKLAMEDGTFLPFDTVTHTDNTLVCKRTGFKGTAIGIEVGGHIFSFAQPYSFSILEAMKKAGGIASILSEGDECDTFIANFNL